MMRKLLQALATTAWILIFSTVYAHAQKIRQKNVPSIVVNALQLKFPKATEANWELIKGYYKARFEIGEVDHTVWLDYSGQIKKHIFDFDESDLPKVIKSAIEKSFNGYEIHNVERIEEGVRRVYYRMKLEKLPDSRRVIFNEGGNIVEDKKLSK